MEQIGTLEDTPQIEENQKMEKTEKAIAGCNTNKKARAYCFTINNYKNADIELLGTLEKECEIFWQKEIGQKGTEHIQGVLRWKNPRSFSQMKEMFPTAHIEICKNWIASKKYCQKIETRKILVRDPLDNIEPNELQKYTLKILKAVPGDRIINWIWEPNGNTGKTTIAKHLCLNYNALYVGGKANDIKFAITQWITKKKDLDIVIIDIPRSLEQFVSYQAIEEVKNGIFFSNKYESGMIMFNSPHVICFANFPPKVDALSKDRWNIVRF